MFFPVAGGASATLFPRGRWDQHRHLPLGWRRERRRMKTKSEILSIDVKLPVEEGHQNHVCRQGQPALEPAPRRPGLLSRREAPPRVPARRQRPIGRGPLPRGRRGQRRPLPLASFPVAGCRDPPWPGSPSSSPAAASSGLMGSTRGSS